MILLNAQTKKALASAHRATTHAYLLSGPEGAGKAYVAQFFAYQKLGLPDQNLLDTYPYFKRLLPQNSTLGIDQIRDLQKFLQLKTLGTNQIRRAAIIEDAHHMTLEAQNALLKSLEEPPQDTILILTAPENAALKETIYSRVQKIAVLPVTLQEALVYFNQQSPALIEKHHLVSGGHAGLLHALTYDAEHPLTTQIQVSKQLFNSTLFSRLARVDELSKQKEQLPLLLKACRLIAGAALQNAIQKHDVPSIKRWHRSAATIHAAEANLRHNPNPKLLLTHLLLTL